MVWRSRCWRRLGDEPPPSFAQIRRYRSSFGGSLVWVGTGTRVCVWCCGRPGGDVPRALLAPENRVKTVDFMS